eukprot:scaffold133047_cov69-Phaeocystis_antarctica.AAC.4
MEVTLADASWVVVAGDQGGCGLHSYEVFVEYRVFRVQSDYHPSCSCPSFVLTPITCLCSVVPLRELESDVYRE